MTTYLESTPQAINLLNQAGFSASALSEGRVLISQVHNAVNELDAFFLQQKAATESFHEEWKNLAALHQVHLHAARRCLKVEVAHLLQLRPETYAGWSGIVSRFYATMLGNSEYQSKLNALSVSTEELARASQWLERLTASKDQQNQSYHNHRSLKQQRDEKFASLKRWFDGLMALARVAFRNEPVLRQMVRPLPTRLSKEARDKLKAQKEEKKLAKSKKGATPVSDPNANGTPTPAEAPAASPEEAMPMAVSVA